MSAKKTPWQNFDARILVIFGLTITVVIWSLLYFVDKPNPRRIEDTPIQIAMNQVQNPIWLGADLQDMAALGDVKGTGVYVQGVLRDSPAQAGGLKRADIITSVDAITINNTADLALFLQGKKDGDRIKLRITRKNEKQSLKIKLQAGKPNQNVAALTPNVDINVDQGAWLGLDVQSLDTVMVRQLKLPDSRGVIISHVVGSSPGAQSGLVRGDVIRTVDKIPVNDRIGFSEVMQGKIPGDQLKLELFRNGFMQEIVVTAAGMPLTTNDQPLELPAADVEVEAAWLGLTVVAVDPLEAKELGLPAGTKGIAVDGISIGPAFNAGFLVGDIIMAINGVPTQTLSQFKEATQGASGAMVDVWRGGRHRFVTVAVPGFDRQGNQLPNSSAASQVAQTLPVDDGMRYVAVAAMGSTASAQVAPIFSKSPYFLIVDLKTGVLNSIANLKFEATGIIAAKWLMQNHIDGVIAGRLGPRAFDVLSNAKIPVYAGAFGQVADIVQAFREGKLKPSVTVLGSKGGR